MTIYIAYYAETITLNYKYTGILRLAFSYNRLIFKGFHKKVLLNIYIFWISLIKCFYKKKNLAFCYL